MIALPTLLSLVLALLCLGFRKKLPIVRGLSILGSFLIFMMALVLFLWILESGPQRLQMGAWQAPYGIAFSVDTLSAILILVGSLIGFVGTIASQAVLNAKQELRGFHVLYHLLMMGVYGAFSTGDLFNLYVWFEILLVSSFVLIAISREQHSLGGDFKYAVLSILGSFLFLFGIALIYSSTGTLDFQDLSLTIKENLQGQGVQLGAIFLLMAFALKAGLVPFHFWLPASYPSTMAPVAAIFSGLLTKVGIYAMLRVLVSPLLIQDMWMWEALRWAALASMVLGVLGAMSRYNIQSILSFHIISQVGYIVLALSLGTKGGIIACVFYLVHHIVVKTNLFFSSAYLQGLSQETDVRKMGNLIDVGWFPTTLFAISALSLVGAPPFSGFWAKVFTLQATMEKSDWLAFVLCLLVSLFTLISMLKIWSEVFWKPAIGNPVRMDQSRLRFIFIPLVLLNIWTIAVGFGSDSVKALSERVYVELTGGEKL
jgi:multicomponent Na+:H+ antiporter subunit D